MICRKETITYKAKPKIYDINRYSYSIWSNPISSYQSLEFILKGNFLNIRNVYLSASNDSIFNFSTATYFDPFSGIKNLSAENIPFYGIKLNSFSFSEKYLIFNFPSVPKENGYVDVIVENEAGYTLLTKGTKVISNNLCERTVPFQKPSVYGISIKIPNKTPIQINEPVTVEEVNWDVEGNIEYNPVTFIDTDLDGFSDEYETLVGTNSSNPLDFPASLFNVFNNI